MPLLATLSLCRLADGIAARPAIFDIEKSNFKVVSTDPIVRLRADQLAANAAYATALLTACTERGKKVQAAVEAVVKQATDTDKDLRVAKRHADAKARKATQSEYDAALRQAAAERKAAVAAADKKVAAAKK